jgi:GNAT superfamily N-acetyltransferase
VITFSVATERDVVGLARMRTSVARAMTELHGKGHWSSEITEARVKRSMMMARVVMAKDGGAIVGSLQLGTRKPWAINPAYFVASSRPLYLTDMAIAPDRQREGIGRMFLIEAEAIARAWPADAIRLDAYEGPAGAGTFYAKCGYTEVGRVRYRGVPLVYYELVL